MKQFSQSDPANEVKMTTTDLGDRRSDGRERGSAGVAQVRKLSSWTTVPNSKWSEGRFGGRGSH